MSIVYNWINLPVTKKTWFKPTLNNLSFTYASQFFLLSIDSVKYMSTQEAQTVTSEPRIIQPNQINHLYLHRPKFCLLVKPTPNI